jgi:hypothetical protein
MSDMLPTPPILYLRFTCVPRGSSARLEAERFSSENWQSGADVFVMRGRQHEQARIATPFS